MTDVSKLQIQVDSTQLNESNKLLIDYSSSAKKAGQGVESLEASATHMGRGMSSITGDVIRQNEALTAQRGSVEDLTNRILILKIARDKFADPAIIQRYTRSIDQLAAQRTELEAFGQAAGASLGRVNKELGRTGFMITNVGYLIQDAPFAIMTGNIASVANNIPMVLNGFQYMMADGKGLWDVFKELGSAMMGPMGLVFLFGSILPSAIEMATHSFGKATKASQDQKQALSDMTSAVQAYASALYDLQKTSVTDPLGIRHLQSDIGNLSNLQDKLGLLRRWMELQDKLQSQQKVNAAPVMAFGLAGLAGQQSGGGNPNDPFGVSFLQHGIEELKKQYGDLSKSQIDEIQKLIEQKKNQLLFNQALLNADPVLKNLQELTTKASHAVRDYNLGLNGSAEALNTLHDQVGKRITQLRSLNTLSESQKEKLAGLVQLYKQTGAAAGKATQNIQGMVDAVSSLQQIGFGTAKLGSGLTRVSGGPLGQLAHTFDTINAKSQLLGPAFDSVQPKIAAVEKAINDIININPNDSRLPELVTLLYNLRHEASKGAQMGVDMAAAFTSAFNSAISSGQSFGKVLESLLQDIEKVLLQAEITGPLMSALFGSTKTGSSGILSPLFGGHRAVGGDVMAGRSYWVGENGPELYTPSASGSIAPAGSPQVSVTVINENGSDVKIAQRRNGNKIEIAAIIRSAMKDNLRSGALDGEMAKNYGITRKGRI